MSQLGMDLSVDGFLRCLAAEDIRGLNFLDDTSATFSKEEHTLTHSHLYIKTGFTRKTPFATYTYIVEEQSFAMICP